MIAALVVVLATAHAHTLDVSTARVTLRDQHLDVDATLDLFLLTKLDPTSLAIAPEAKLVEELARVGQALRAESHLTVDGTEQPLTMRGLPTPPEFRALAATLSASGDTHGARVRVLFDAAQAVPQARRVELTLPPAAGPVLVTFVQPESRYVQPWTSAAFEVLEAPTPAPSSRWAWIGGSSLIAGAAWAGRWLRGASR